MKSYIFLKKIRFYAYHGVLPQERVVGNSFVVDLVLEADIFQAAETDQLAHTVSYAEVFELVSQEMNVPSYLLEHVAGRITKALRQKFPSVKQIDISICKEHPPIEGQMEGAGIRLVTE